MTNNSINLAFFYDLLFGSQTQDIDFYKYFIDKNNGLALEVGSGTGRLLLKYMQSGFNIEGIEPNKDMTEICLKKANTLNLKPIIHQQQLQELNLQKKYKTIYMPLFAFQNIIDKDEAIKSLKLTYNHLETNGQILITIFLPWNDPTGTWEQTWRNIKVTENNNETVLLSESVSFDKLNQIETKHFKHELFHNNTLTQSYFSTIKFRTYSPNELTAILEHIGYKNIEILGDYINQEAFSDTNTFIFSAFK